ncbi:MAG: hypothetical protein AAF616_04180 [Bacteroidota bacterium]
MIKAVKVLNLLSLLLFAAILLLVYAFLPVEVNLNIDGFSNVNKQTLFYQLLGLFIIVNILLQLLLKFGVGQWKESDRAWVGLLVFIVNFYLASLFGFLGVLNNASSISPDSYAYLNLIAPLLLIVWLVGLIILAFKRYFKRSH